LNQALPSSIIFIVSRIVFLPMDSCDTKRRTEFNKFDSLDFFFILEPLKEKERQIYIYIYIYIYIERERERVFWYLRRRPSTIGRFTRGGPYGGIYLSFLLSLSNDPDFFGNQSVPRYSNFATFSRRASESRMAGEACTQWPRRPTSADHCGEKSGAFDSSKLR